MSAKKGRTKKDDVVELRYWTFKFVDKSFGVVVEGYRDNDATGSKMDNWGSSQIKSAAENGKLLTSLSGSKYRLVDNIARVEQKKYGIPDSMIDLFEKGFPRNWEQILRPFYQKWFETNPLNAAKWWDHQQTLEKKRASLGVSLKKRSQSTGAVPRTQQLEAEKENQTGLMTPTKTTDDSIIRRSPRIMPTVMATPNVMKSFSTTALNNDKNDNEPTPRFCPVTDGRHAISRQSTVKVPPESTPTKGKMPRRSRELVIPDVPAERQTPRRSRAAKTPTTKMPAAAEATPIRRSLRSQSVLPTPSATSTPKLQAKATPKGTPRANSRAPSASPARKPAAKTPASAQKKKSPASSPAPARPQSVAKTENSLEFKAPPPVVKVPAEENVFKAPPPKVIKGEVLDSRRAMSVSSIHSATVLFDWFIQFHPNQVKKTGALPPFYFTGTKRTNGAQPLGWNTSPIVRVDEGANQFDWTFYTSSGNQYKISGRVNVREMAEQQIFPMEVAKAFEFGFPSNWLELLWNVFNAYRDKGFKKPLLAPRHTESDGNESVRSGQVNVNQTVTHAKSQRGRSLYTPLEHSFKMPQLSAERGGGERIKQKKRSIKYASSDDDDDTDAFMKTLRMSRYNYDSDHGPAGKRARRSNTGDLTADMRIIKNIQKRKAKLTREIAELDEYMFQVANKIDRKRREEKRLEDLHRGWEQQQPPRQRSRAGSELSSRKRKFQPIYEESESSSESSDQDSEDELKALSDSTSTDCDDGGDWRQARLKKNKKKFVPPPTNNNRRSKEKANIFEEENKTSESEEEDETEEIPKPKKEKKRKWTQEDLTRLKHVVSHVKVRKEEDWQKIANTMGQEFKAEDCKDMAVKRLNWKAPKEKTSKPEEEAMVITTRPGTLGHAIQAGEECRKYLLGAGSQELDGFRRQAMDGEDDEQDIVANIAELDPDDSILEALKTPKLATASFKKSKNRTDQPFLPTLFADEDTPKTNGRKSLALEEPTTAKREENLRYLHEINRTDRSRLNNTTRMNMSTTNYSMIDRSRAADQVARKMDKITKTVRDQIPKRKPTSDVDEEDEEEM